MNIARTIASYFPQGQRFDQTLQTPFARPKPACSASASEIFLVAVPPATAVREFIAAECIFVTFAVCLAAAASWNDLQATGELGVENRSRSRGSSTSNLDGDGVHQ